MHVRSFVWKLEELERVGNQNDSDNWSKLTCCVQFVYILKWVQNIIQTARTLENTLSIYCRTLNIKISTLV